jgi:putative membrane protein
MTMAPLLLEYLHYLSIFVLFALLSVEHVQFKLPLDLRRARSLLITDLAYGACAMLVLITGAWRLWLEKGLDYYLNNGFFLAKLGLVLLVGLLSSLPTLTFINWRNDLKAGTVPTPSPRQARWVIGIIRLELLLLMMIPLLAVLMARGQGIFRWINLPG